MVAGCRDNSRRSMPRFDLPGMKGMDRDKKGIKK
jgi:hypothetical protein